MEQSNSKLSEFLKKARDQGLVNLVKNKKGQFVTPANQIIEPIYRERKGFPHVQVTVHIIADESNSGIWTHYWGKP